MRTQMVGEDENSFTMHDGKSPFMVPKRGLSEALQDKIRTMADPKKMATGGAVAFGGAGGPPVIYDANGNPIASAAPSFSVDQLQGVNTPTRPGFGNISVVPPNTPPQPDALNAHIQELQAAPTMHGQAAGDADEVTRAEQHELASLPRKQAAALGIGPPGSAAPNKPDVPDVAPAPPPAVKPMGGGFGGVGGPGLKFDEKGVNEQKAAAMAGAQIADEKGQLQAAEQIGYTKRLEQQAIDDQLKHAKIMAEVDAKAADWKATQDEIKNIDTTVDPGRFWASRSTGQKVLGVIGLALGALGTGPDGINRAAAMMNQAVDRDLEAQKAEFALRLKKGQSAVDAAQSAYGMAYQKFGTESAASNAARAAMLDVFKSKTAAIAAGKMGPEAQNNAAAFIGKLDEGIGEAKNKLAQENYALATQRTSANASMLGAQASAMAAGARSAGSPAENKELHSAEAAAQNSLDLVGKIREGLNKTNSWVPGATTYMQNVGDDAAALETNHQALVVELKNLAKLGALSGGDSAILEKMIGDPSAFWAMEGSKQAKLKALEGVITRSIQNQRKSVAGGQASIPGSK